MRIFNRKLTAAVVLLAGLCVGAAAVATPVTLDFDQLNPNGEHVADYYNGGCATDIIGFAGTCGGPDYGVTWSGAALANDGAFWSNPPSSPNFIQRFGLGQMVMNVAAGFADGFSFYYSAGFHQARVTLYDGLNGTGNVLATTGYLSPTSLFCNGGFGTTGCWTFVDGLSFSGLAYSVVFQAPILGAAYDNISFNLADSANAVPEPSALGLFGLGLVLLGVVATRRRRTQ